MLNLVIIMGAGEKRDGEWLGLRSFSESMEKKYNLKTTMFQEDEGAFIDLGLDEMAHPILGVGHSFGGYELLTRDYDGVVFESIVALDPKPKPWYQWWNIFYEFPLPSGVSQNYWGGFGRPFKAKQNSIKLDIKHEDFPSNPDVQKYIESEIARLTEVLV